MVSDPTIEDLKVFVNSLLAIARERFGERVAAIMMIGVPVEGGHDRFAAHVIGPCLAARGLLDWGTASAKQTIASFHNPADPPVANGGIGKGGAVVVMANKITGGGSIGGFSFSDLHASVKNKTNEP